MSPIPHSIKLYVIDLNLGTGYIPHRTIMSPGLARHVLLCLNCVLSENRWPIPFPGPLLANNSTLFVIEIVYNFGALVHSHYVNVIIITADSSYNEWIMYSEMQRFGGERSRPISGYRPEHF
jgi:hypothetical protein